MIAVLVTAWRRYRHFHGPRVDGLTAVQAGEFSLFADPANVARPVARPRRRLHVVR